MWHGESERMRVVKLKKLVAVDDDDEKLNDVAAVAVVVPLPL